MMYFEKSQPAPAKLALEKTKKSGTYRLPEVLERLKEDFKNKCYICEQKAPTSINVEHFKPHKEDVNLKFDWNNLFWACSHCNNTKLDQYDPLLNCTDAVDEVEKKLQYMFNPFPYEKVEIKALDSATNTENTRRLLLAVFNGTTKLKSIESDNLRESLLEEVMKFQTLLVEYFNDLNSEEDLAYYDRKIRQHLDKGSAFTSFKRWIIRGNERLKQEFEKYFN